jgi:hypothetical protein
MQTVSTIGLDIASQFFRSTVWMLTVRWLSVLAGTRSDSWCLVELSGLVSDVIRLRSFSPSLSASHPGRSALGFSQSTNVPDVAAPHYIP